MHRSVRPEPQTVPSGTDVADLAHAEWPAVDRQHRLERQHAVLVVLTQPDLDLPLDGQLGPMSGEYVVAGVTTPSSSPTITTARRPSRAMTGRSRYWVKSRGAADRAGSGSATHS